MATETELKLAIDPTAASNLGQQAVIRNHAASPPQRRHLESIYFDTPGLDLRGYGIGLRLRHSDDCWIQTIKTTGQGRGGLHQRGEWESEVGGEALDLTHLDDPRIRKIFADTNLREQIQPVFTTRFWRTSWDLLFPDGSHIELALDQGEVQAGDASAPISEVELELKSGSPARLFEVARSLAEALPMRLSNTSKAARGIHLIESAPAPAGIKAGPLGLETKMTAEQGLQDILWHVLTHLHDNEPVVLENPDDIEGVHQMRVATRRMRSCLNVFRPLIPKEVSGHLGEQIKWLTDALGPARDWDVFLDETLESLQTHFPGHGSLQSLIQGARRQRAQAYEQAQTALRSRRYTQLLLGLGAWIERRDWRDAVSPEQLQALDSPVARFAIKVLDKRHKQVSKRGDRFAELSIDERHELRILCKKLRYAAEFFIELWGKKAAKPYIRSLSKLQDTLGVLNDAAVAHTLIDQLTSDPMHPGAQLVYGWTAATTDCHLAEFNAAWVRFSAQHQFWK